MNTAEEQYFQYGKYYGHEMIKVNKDGRYLSVDYVQRPGRL